MASHAMTTPPSISPGSPIRVIATAGAVDASGLTSGTDLLAGAPYSLEVSRIQSNLSTIWRCSVL
jgi:hypothetical protein